MNLRKIAVVGGFAAGAALAFAPLASADDLSSAVSGEESLLNGIFAGDATLAGDSTDIIQPTATQPFDTIPLVDAPDSGTPTLLDYELYGLNPIANAASDPGAYNVFNGALTEFSDAYNVELFSLANPSAAIDTIPSADLFGSASVISEALGESTAAGAAGDFFSAGLADLAGLL
jgi:hypothetical protein